MKRFSLLGVLFILSFTTLLFLANFQKNTNTISINNPEVMKASIILLVILFLPPILLAFFKGRKSRMFSFYYQSLFLLGFLILIPTALLDFNGIPITILAVCGFLISLWSMTITKPSK